MVTRVVSKGAEFAARADKILEDMIRTQYDCSFLSMVRPLKEWKLYEKPYYARPHMGPIANMIISREVYVRMHEIVAYKVKNDMDIRIPPFSMNRRGGVARQPLRRSQENYLKTYKTLNYGSRISVGTPQK